ncbi:MAG: hypothetical protein K2G63_06765 [Oscillospiraceae bacterium]|nr:hypothetical protein [Oscillospiraceae bacterium]
MSEINNNLPSSGGGQGGSGLSIASMILGILATVLSCCYYYVSFPCAIIGLILGAVAIKKTTAEKVWLLQELF